MSYDISGPRHADLPAVDPVYDGTGYDFMEALSNGWHVVSNWGSEGWDLGQWPYVIIALYVRKGDDTLYGVCEFVEHDVTITSHLTRQDAYQRIDELAEVHWRQHENGPKDLPPEKGLHPYHCGPYLR